MNGPDPDQDLGRRLRALADHRVPDATRQQHLDAIDAELARHAGTAGHAPALRGDADRRRWTRRWAAGLATATALVLPAGAAVAASQAALPGDVLYPIKQLTEPVQGVFQPDVAARHRVDELEALLARGASPEALRRAAEAARLAVAGLPEHHPLHERLAGLLALLLRPPATPDEQAPVPGPGRVTERADGSDSAVEDADDDTDRLEPRDEPAARDVDDEGPDGTDPTDGAEEDDEDEDQHQDPAQDQDEQEDGRDLKGSEPTDDNGPDDDGVGGSEDADPDESDSDEVDDRRPVGPTVPDDDESEHEDATEEADADDDA